MQWPPSLPATIDPACSARYTVAPKRKHSCVLTIHYFLPYSRRAVNTLLLPAEPLGLACLQSNRFLESPYSANAVPSNGCEKRGFSLQRTSAKPSSMDLIESSKHVSWTLRTVKPVKRMDIHNSLTLPSPRIMILEDGQASALIIHDTFLVVSSGCLQGFGIDFKRHEALVPRIIFERHPFHRPRTLTNPHRVLEMSLKGRVSQSYRHTTALVSGCVQLMSAPHAC